VIASVDIEGALAGIGVAPDFAFTGGQADSDIPFLHRHLTDGEDYFLVNRKPRAETIEAHFRITGKAPELWHAETGATEPVFYRITQGETVVPLALEAEDAVHVVFRKPAAADALTVPKPTPVVLATLNGPWNLAFQPGRGAPAAATLPALAPLEQNANPGIKYFSGLVTYTKAFAAPRGWRPGQALWLDLGAVHELAEVSVNGRLVGTAWHAPFSLEIGAAMHKGENQLEVRVANLWLNRLIGDAQKGAGKDTPKITWTALPTYRADAPLHPSGLIGPVTLSAR
jgi:hypothetical protein